MRSEMQKYWRPQGQCSARPAPPGFEAALARFVSRLRFDADAARSRDGEELHFEDHRLAVMLCYFVRPHRPPEPSTTGVVTVHVRYGSLRMTVDGQVHELRGGQMLVLAPALKHTGIGGLEGAMRLNVILVEDGTCEAEEAACERHDEQENDEAEGPGRRSAQA